MNERQRRFVDFYLQSANATEAARKAGYKSPKVTGAKLLTNANLRAEIDRRLEAFRNSQTADVQEILEHLTAVIRGQLTETVISASGKKFDIPVNERDKLKAAEMLLKVNGAFRERVEVRLDPCEQFAKAVEAAWENVAAAD